MPDQQVTTSTKLWSEEVAQADAQSGEVLKPKIPAYEFTGRTFYTPETEPYTR